MRFNIRLIHHVDPVPVAQLEKERVRRVVGGAHAVDVELFHERDVPQQFLRRHGIAARRGAVMMVDAAELDCLPVQEIDAAPDLHRLKAVPLAYDLAHVAAHILQGQIEIVELRLLRVPLPHVEIFKAELPVSRAAGDRRDDLVPIQEGGLHRTRRRIHRQINIQRVPHSVFLGAARVVPDMGALRLIEQHIAEDPVVAEHVLTLQIGAVGPLVHHGHQLVAAVEDLIRQVELRRIMRALGIPHIASVEIDLDARRRPEEGDHKAALRLFHVKKSPVHAYGIIGAVDRPKLPGRHIHPCGLVRGNPGRVIFKLILLIDVKGLLIPSKLPAGRDRDPVKIDRIRIKIDRDIIHLLIVFKVPLPAQKLYQRAGRTLVQQIGLLRLPLGRKRDKVGP